MDLERAYIAGGIESAVRYMNNQTQINQDIRKELNALYVVLFDTEVIKIGRTIRGFRRVGQHMEQARCFGVKTLQFHIEECPTITELDLIRFCNQHGTLHHGNEYFKDLDFDVVVNFLKPKVERKSFPVKQKVLKNLRTQKVVSIFSQQKKVVAR